LKTKNFHWHERSTSAITICCSMSKVTRFSARPTARRARSQDWGPDRAFDRHIAKLQRIRDNDAGFVDPDDMLQELMRTTKPSCTRCAKPTTWPTSMATRDREHSGKLHR
jgi:hypothetical protein